MFTNETTYYEGVLLRRIRAKKSFTLITGETIKKGQLGGFIQNELNLAHDGNCWVSFDSKVFGIHTRIRNDALVSEESIVGEACWIDGKVWIHGKSEGSLLCAHKNTEVIKSRIRCSNITDFVKIVSSDVGWVNANEVNLSETQVVYRNILQDADCMKENRK